ncbi:unnamed protein product [Paramecium pentaurelia]|uniref:Uncharacterized protein n=1 Tax=Paramecium pentaurelia TaxID=43138 RepID=A0A8S1WXR4_9CILI|nr:unnamed protein product [Paramecium pentaurelia]
MICKVQSIESYPNDQMDEYYTIALFNCYSLSQTCLFVELSNLINRYFNYCNRYKKFQIYRQLQLKLQKFLQKSWQIKFLVQPQIYLMCLQVLSNVQINPSIRIDQTYFVHQIIYIYNCLDYYYINITLIIQTNQLILIIDNINQIVLQNQLTYIIQ